MTAESVDFIVRRDDLAQTQWVDSQTRADSPLEPNDVLLRVDRFALTSNNITYALVGESFHYWKFFPAPDGWGRVPVWGFADVIASQAPGVREGDRVFGYLPMSTYLRIRAQSVTDDTIVDASEHRLSLPAAYQQYSRTRPTEPEKEGIRALLSPLFGTGFLIDDWLHEHAEFGATQLVFASASSKTAISTAFLLSARPERTYKVIGLTSPSHRAFCERLGYYDEVVEYAALAGLPAETPTVFIDMAGDPDVLRAVHQHFGASLRYSCVVGMTHQPANLAAPAGLVGPAPQLFSAPTQIDQRLKAWGPDVLRARVNDAQRAFLASALTWLELTTVRGPGPIEQAYRSVLTGQAKPNEGLILTF
jgi:hypothetical protein